MGYQLIEHIEVGSGGAESVEFLALPQDAVDLVVTSSARADNTQNSWRMQFNTDTGANYKQIDLTGSGSAASSAGYSGISYVFTNLLTPSTYTANTFSNIQVYISNYTSSSAKSFSLDGVQENNATASRQSIYAGSWSGTDAITSLKVFTSGGSYLFAEHSSFSIYKITAD